MRTIVAALVIALAACAPPTEEKAKKKYAISCFSAGQLIMQGTAVKIWFSPSGWTFFGSDEDADPIYTNLECIVTRVSPE